MPEESSDFIRQRIRQDLSEGVTNTVVTRFPPEPNGYLTIGHAKSICLNFGVAEEFGGRTFLRFDDTNPLKESEEFVEAIQRDVAWLGFSWGDAATFASDYFEALYGFAEQLVERGKAYVDSQSVEEIAATRGTFTTPGTESPYRGRPAAENLDLFRRMRAGEFPDGAHVLRAKIDMTASNIVMRDPVLYRIRHATHHRTGDDWCIYPMYDFTHCLSDALEGITHSLCTLEFENNRELYDWVLDNVDVNFHPPQIEFSRLNLEFTVMSTRFFRKLVEGGHVAGWDDPRLPTISGLRRRGYTPEMIRDFCRRVGVTRQENRVAMELLDFCARQALEDTAPRGMAVLDPLPVTIVNYPSDEDETLEAPWHGKHPEMGARAITFGRSLAIEREDFMEEPPRKFRRLSPGGLVRLRYGYVIRCDEVVRDDGGAVVELRCTYFPESKSGSDTSGLKPKGVVHWVSRQSGRAAAVRVYDRLFSVPAPTPDNMEGELNPASLEVAQAIVEPGVVEADTERFQFERVGYFFKDPVEHSTRTPVFNRIVTLRDSYRPEAT
ncbi:MAG: glutamine--tRNA ligase/YqeY domain fusion protein [Gammaproteobacteria bacterium]|nr:glutamine--tRNA ligase/YqeY domain fusion protein [Gammaproteobacteria bacterium]